MAGLDDPQDRLQVLSALIRLDGNVERGGHGDQAPEVAGGGGLLDERQAITGHGVDCAHRQLGRVGFVGVDHQRNILTDGRAHIADACDIELRLAGYLDLQVPKPGLRQLCSNLGHALRRFEWNDPGIGKAVLPFTAIQIMQGHAERASPQVEQAAFDSGLYRQGAMQPSIQSVHDGADCGLILPDQALAKMTEGCLDCGERLRPGRHRADIAVAFHALCIRYENGKSPNPHERPLRKSPFGVGQPLIYSDRPDCLDGHLASPTSHTMHMPSAGLPA